MLRACLRGSSSTRAAVGALAAALAITVAARAQVEIIQGRAPNSTDDASHAGKAGQRRTIQVFDFEEPDNPYPVPKHWVRLIDTEATPRPGFPRFNEAAFDFGVAHGGQASVRLPCRGGSTSLRLVPGTLPVFPQGDYAVSGFVRTRGLQAARAYLTARFLDQNQRLVPGTETRSPAIVSDEEWTPVTVELVGLSDAVAFLQIELQLLQPREQPGSRVAGDVEGPDDPIHVEDLDASAWFDEISISQIPRVEIKSTQPGNTFTHEQTPTLVMTIRDLVGERLTAVLRVFDLEGRKVADAELPVSASGRPMEWTPSLLKPGWYRVVLQVRSDERVLTTEETALAWLAERPPERSRELSRFGLHADRAEPWQSASILHLQESLGFGHMALSVWGDQEESAAIPAAVEQIGPMLDELLVREVSATLCLPRLPDDLAAKHSLDPEDPLSIALVDEEEWVPLMNAAFDRYGQRITRWQIGRVAPRESLPGEGGDEAFWGGSLPSAVERMHRSLSALVPGPQVAVPWRTDLEVSGLAAGTTPASRPASAMMFAPYWADRDAIESFSRAWGMLSTPRPELTIIPQFAPSTTSDADRVTSLSRQIIECWRLLASVSPDEPPARLSASHPWTVRGSRRRHMAPTPDLAVWASVADRLAGRRIVGEYPAPEGVRCYILAPIDATGPTVRIKPTRTAEASTDDLAGESDTGADGALVLWNESAEPDKAFVHVYAPASHTRVLDPLGRERAMGSPDPHRPTEDVQRIRAVQMPMFIEGVDSRLSSLIASFRVDPDFLPAIAAEHQLEMQLTNPWPTTLTGRLQIIPPGSVGPDGTPAGRARRPWTLAPDGIIAINIPPGQTQVIPFAATLPASEDAGEKQLTAILRLDSDQHRAPIHLDTRVHVGLQDIGLHTKVDLGPNIDGPNVVLTLQITNRGRAERFLRVQVRVPGLPMRELVLANPTVGEAISKRFVFKDAAAELRGKRLRVSITDSESAARLNATVNVP